MRVFKDLYLLIEVTRCHYVFKKLGVSEPSMWEKSHCVYLKFLKCTEQFLKICKKAKMENMWNLKNF